MSPSKCEIKITLVPLATWLLTKVEELLGRNRIKRRGRLIENDKAQRNVGHGEGAGDLRHLALADGQIGNGVIGLYAMAGKNLVEFCTRPDPGCAFSSPCPSGRHARCGHFRQR